MTVPNFPNFKNKRNSSSGKFAWAIILIFILMVAIPAFVFSLYLLWELLWENCSYFRQYSFGQFLRYSVGFLLIGLLVLSGLIGITSEIVKGITHIIKLGKEKRKKCLNIFLLCFMKCTLVIALNIVNIFVFKCLIVLFIILGIFLIPAFIYRAVSSVKSVIKPYIHHAGRTGVGWGVGY